MNSEIDLEKFSVGRNVCFAGICSSSEEKDVALTFMEMKPYDRQQHVKTLFKLHAKKAISVTKYSEYAVEKEVVIGFCSKWKVLSVQENKNETFSFGVYRCDYVIELEQLDSEPLFNMTNKLTGLALLSQIDEDLLKGELAPHTAAFLVDLIALLDAEEKKILKEHLEEHWDELSNCFEDCIRHNVGARENLFNFLTGLSGLRTELEANTVGYERGLVLCGKNKIYDAYSLLHTEANAVRSIDGFVQLGFSREEGEKLFFQDKHRQMLVHYYKLANLKGTFHSPELLSSIWKNLRLKHYIKRDGVTVSLYGLTRITVRTIKYSFKLSEKKFFELCTTKMLGRNVSYYAGWSDVIAGALVTAVHIGIYAMQLWYGDITLKQFFKSISVAVVSVVAGGFGTIGGMMLGAVVASIIGGPVSLLIGVGGIVGGAIVGITSETVFRYLVETFFPDGQNEEINAQRKLYTNALKVFNCLPDSSFDSVKRSYYALAQANHPDKCDDKKTATEKFQSIVAAFEIVKKYHEVLEEKCKLLELDVKDLGIDTLKKWEQKNKTKMGDSEVKKAYNVAYRHIAYTSNKWQRFRTWLDGDRNLVLGKPVAAIQAAP